MTFFIETYGCQMNKAESAAILSLFRERGWSEAFSADCADFILINTCSVRTTAETRAWGRISHYAAQKRSRNFTLAITGCMAERQKDEMKKTQPAIDYLVGTFQKQEFSRILDAVESGIKLELLDVSPAFVFASNHREKGAFHSYLPIMHGCDNFCSYCIVPYVRGREISRSPESIQAEIASLEDDGVKELTLLGQNVNSYRWKASDGILDFPSLLRMLVSDLRASGKNSIRWIRFLTSHPKDLSSDLIVFMASEPLLCRHIHLCVQHGSNRILEAMNRKYTREDYLALVDLIRKHLPDVSLSTDILVGFPGETEEDVEQTLDLMRHVEFTASYMYYFNPRQGTVAASLPMQVPTALKKERLARVIATQKEISAHCMSRLVGTSVDVLIESVSRRSKTELLGRSAADMMAVFEGDPARVGSFATVRLDSLRGTTFKATETA